MQRVLLVNAGFRAVRGSRFLCVRRACVPAWDPILVGGVSGSVTLVPRQQAVYSKSVTIVPHTVAFVYLDRLRYPGYSTLTAYG